MAKYVLIDEDTLNVLKYSEDLSEIVDYALKLERANVGWLEDLTISRLEPSPEILYFGRGILGYNEEDWKDTPM